MAKTFRNQIIISKEESNKIRLENAIKLEGMLVYYDENVPVIQSNKAILFGWAWNCVTGKKVNKKEISNLDSSSIIELTKDFSGRYIIIIEGRYIYTDATSSYPLYYTENYASSNLSLISDIIDESVPINKVYTKPTYLAPSTGVKKVKRLIPGEYYDYKEGRAISIPGFLAYDDLYTGEEKHKLHIVQYLKGCAKGLYNLTGDNYRLMLTAGKDSRLSLLCLYSVVGKKLKTFTHKKPFMLNDMNDIKTPNILSRTLEFDHFFTYSRKNPFSEEKSIMKHNARLFGEMQAGSTFYYYLKSNWFQLEEEYLIDNYYEIGRMHLHGKGIMDSQDKVNLSNIHESGVKMDEESYDHLIKHLSAINPNSIDKLDIFYFIKNYINVGNQFELIDYSHTPLVFCNSLQLFRLLLSVPEELRKNGLFHMSLMEELSPESAVLPECNKNSNSLISKIMRRLRRHIGIWRFKYIDK